MWEQVYDPVGNQVLSTLIAAIPVVLLLGLLGFCHVAAHWAALAGLGSALGIALFAYGMPAGAAFASAALGAGFGLFPIGWIVFSAIFLYNLTVATGQFEIVKDSVASLSADRRVQVILIAFCFGAFIEGAAGFGTPVAISAALLMGLGFSPLHAAGLALIANTSPVAFGALGTPILTLARITAASSDPVETDRLANLYSAMAGRQLPFFSIIVPVWLVAVMGGLRALRGVWPAMLVAGGSFAVVQWATANYFGPTIVDVAGGLVSLAATAVLLKVWQPKANPEFQGAPAAAEPAPTGAEPKPAPCDPRRHTFGAILYAWVPWLLLSVFVFAWGLPAVKAGLNNLSRGMAWNDAANKGAPVSFPMPGLHRQVALGPEVRGPGESGVKDAAFNFNWLSATGTGILFAAVLSAVWLRVGPRLFAATLIDTSWRLRFPLLTIACMLSLGYVTQYSGQDVTLGLAFTKTGAVYPFFAAMLGWLGVALTGSDTSSNVLFGNLQKTTAHQLVDAGVLTSLNRDQAAVLLCTANSTGGVMGKMIDAQSIVVAAAATGQHGTEGEILRYVFWHSLVLAALVGVLILIQAYWWTASIPG
jgi:lactate permease